MESNAPIDTSRDYHATLTDAARLGALDATRLLDTAPSPVFEDIARRASQALGVPSALVSLVDGTRQFFAGEVGLSEPWASCRQTPLTHSLCRYVVVDRSPLVVGDAREHAVLHDNGAVVDLGIVAYLGVPLLTTSGHVLGACCVADGVPRAWTETDLAALSALGAEASREIERLLAGPPAVAARSVRRL